MKSIKLKKTCIACPAQWEGTLDDGRMIYIRYRWGHLTVNVSLKPTTNIGDALDGPTVFDEHPGEDSLDGSLETEEMLHLLKDTLENV